MGEAYLHRPINVYTTPGSYAMLHEAFQFRPNRSRQITVHLNVGSVVSSPKLGLPTPLFARNSYV